MQLHEFLGFHSGINNLNFLLLYEATLLGKWLQTFRQTVRVAFSNGQTSKMILPVKYMTFLIEKFGKQLASDEGV